MGAFLSDPCSAGCRGRGRELEAQRPAGARSRACDAFFFFSPSADDGQRAWDVATE